MTLARLENELSREELLMWMAKHRIDPIGPQRDDFNAAATRATMINLAHLAGENKRPAAVEVRDMMPRFGVVKRTASKLSPKQIWQAWANYMNRR